jgi:hypothetical protein
MNIRDRNWCRRCAVEADPRRRVDVEDEIVSSDLSSGSPSSLWVGGAARRGWGADLSIWPRCLSSPVALSVRMARCAAVGLEAARREASVAPLADRLTVGNR